MDFSVSDFVQDFLDGKTRPHNDPRDPPKINTYTLGVTKIRGKYVDFVVRSNRNLPKGRIIALEKGLTKKGAAEKRESFRARAISDFEGSQPSTYLFGVVETRSGKAVTFVVRPGKRLPDGEVLAQGEAHCTAEEAFAKADNLWNILKGLAPAAIVPGAVTHHADGAGGAHQALVLDIEYQSCKALFCTSHPGWNSKSRKATQDELALMGFQSSTTTWLAPVVRPLNEFSLDVRATFPDHRIETLRQEFFPL
jgi:hypothetical protein